jgi:hypothetical protein
MNTVTDPVAQLGGTSPQGAAAANARITAVPQPRHASPGRDRPRIWLPAAAAGLCALAGAAATVSYAAQFQLAFTARHSALVAGLEAAIPDAAALVFACLGVALALHGSRAVRARLLNVASAGASVFMNVIAAAPGWRDLAVWAMPPTAYALASDTLIGVVRTGAAARHQAAAGPVTEELSLLAVTRGIALWLLRLAMAPVSTMTGFRAWVIEECPVAPGRRAHHPAPAAVPPKRTGPRLAAGETQPDHARSSPNGAGTGPRRAPGERPADRPRSSPDGGDPPNEGAAGSSRRGETKTARFLALVTSQHGPLAAIPLESVSPISAAVAPQADLNPGSARAALRRAVLAARKGPR